MSIDVTIIIPTHERHDMVLRSMKYFSQSEYQIIYVDSSEKKLSTHWNYKNISYFHLPRYKFSQKALFGIEKSHTALVGFCADDDFLLFSGINIALSFLQSNSGYSSAVGRFLAFDQGSTDFYRFQSYNCYPSIAADTRTNVVNFMSNYRQVLWGVYYKKHIKDAYLAIDASDFSNDNFIELVIGTLMSARGGVKVLDEVLGVRERAQHDNWGSRHTSIFKALHLESTENDIRNAIDHLSKYVSRDLATLGVFSYIESKLNPAKYNNGVGSRIAKDGFITRDCHSKNRREYVETTGELELICNVLLETRL